MAFNGSGKKKAACADCRKELGFKDYICVPDPYSSEDLEKPKRVNLCVKCYEKRVDNKDKMLGNKDIEGKSETIITSDSILDMIQKAEEALPPEQRSTSTNKRKVKKRKKKLRRELIRKFHEEKAKLERKRREDQMETEEIVSACNEASGADRKL